MRLGTPHEPHPDALLYLGLSSGVPCTENDYKLWSPSDERGNECLLGHKTVFKRRTPHATCFNGEDFDRPVVVSNCSCTREDYEWLVLLALLGRHVALCSLSKVGKPDKCMALPPVEEKGIEGNEHFKRICYVPGIMLDTSEEALCGSYCCMMQLGARKVYHLFKDKSSGIYFQKDDLKQERDDCSQDPYPRTSYFFP